MSLGVSHEHGYASVAMAPHRAVCGSAGLHRLGRPPAEAFRRMAVQDPGADRHSSREGESQQGQEGKEEASGVKEGGDASGDSLDLLGGQFGEHGEGEDFPG